MTSLPPHSSSRDKIGSVTRANPIRTDSRPGTQYRAFLSYSHKDEALAGKLHRRLESYRLPKNLIGTETVRGSVPAKLSPIFRDREELSAGESLSDRIRAALEVSETLIILCSPNAKASHWVAQEIRLFRELHPDRPVLAALIDGEPEEAFPDPLTEGGAEPIAPDFRKGKDGFRLGLLKLVAGISGVPLDALVQRDAQRQLRRVTAITGGALVAVLVMSLLLVTAVRAQREAERQRAEAEGLVEYMLTDLRDRLKGVGRLDVMGAVNERAMKYYGVGTPEGQLLKARILHAMGEDEDTKGNLVSAAQNFRDAETLTARIFKTRPEDQSVIFAHAQSEYWLGYDAMKAGRVSTMRTRFSNYRNLTYRLESLEPSNARWKKEAAYAEGNLCTAYLTEPKKPEIALRHCKNALSQMKAADRLLGSPSETQRSIANRYVWLAEAHEAVGNETSALASRLEQQKIALRLVSTEPSNAANREVLVKARLSLAAQLKRQGRGQDAREYLVEARREASELLKIEPNNALYIRLNEMASQ